MTRRSCTGPQLHGYEALPRPDELAADDATIADGGGPRGRRAGLARRRRRCSSPPRRCGRPTPSAGRSRSSAPRTPTRWRRVVREHHLFWFDERDDLGRAPAAVRGAVNRQYAKHRVLRETGAIQLVARRRRCARARQMVGDRHCCSSSRRRGARHRHSRTWSLPAAGSSGATVVFRVRANARVGSGHLLPLPAAGRGAGRPAPALPAASTATRSWGSCSPSAATLTATRPTRRPTCGARAARAATSSSTTCSTRPRPRCWCERSAGLHGGQRRGPRPRRATGRLGRQRALPGRRHGAAQRRLRVPAGPRCAASSSTCPRRRSARGPSAILITFGGTDPGAWPRASPGCSTAPSTPRSS